MTTDTTVPSQLGVYDILSKIADGGMGTVYKAKNRTTGDMFFLGWGPALEGQGTIEQLFQAKPTYSSYGNNKTIDEKIARAQTLMDPKARAEAYAELQRLIRDEVPWVFLWQQHDLYGVASWIEWTPRADEKVWMYEAKIVAR